MGIWLQPNTNTLMWQILKTHDTMCMFRSVFVLFKSDSKFKSRVFSVWLHNPKNMVYIKLTPHCFLWTQHCRKLVFLKTNAISPQCLLHISFSHFTLINFIVDVPFFPITSQLISSSTSFFFSYIPAVSSFKLILFSTSFYMTSLFIRILLLISSGSINLLSFLICVLFSHLIIQSSL